VPLYDSIGGSYRNTRAADPRIADELTGRLGRRAGSRVADVGAGIGAYSNVLASRGLRVIAVEPSAVMRGQRTAHPGVHWIAGLAEAIPIADQAVEAVVCTLAVHHFGDPSSALREMVRISCGGPVVLFTFDPFLYPDFWLYDYFPALSDQARRRYPASERIRALLEGCGCESVEVTEFPLPRDLRDRFTASGWGEPEIYLDSSARANMSPFRLLPAADVDRGVSQLRQDLGSGKWDALYGHLRALPRLSVGYVFVAGVGRGSDRGQIQVSPPSRPTNI
jgi:SAM-dependent methyltransferase